MKVSNWIHLFLASSLVGLMLPSPSLGFVTPGTAGSRIISPSQILLHFEGLPKPRLIYSTNAIQQTLQMPSRGASTQMNAQDKMSAQDVKEAESSGFNFGLIAQNIANQALIGITIWTGGYGYQVLTKQAEFGTSALLFAVAGLVPLLAISRAVETSESYAVSGLNLSTNMAVLRLFGSKPQPVSTFLISALIAGLTGVVEETIFRGTALPFLAERFGNGDPLVGAALSTILFAVLHTNPASFFKGGEAAADNLVLLNFQLINGAIFAALYLGTGNLAVPIITHGLYDFYTFYKTHMVDVAGQMAYAKNESKIPKFSNKANELRWKAQKGENFVNGVQESFYLMDTNKDGVLSRKEIRVALFSYGINLSKEQSEKVFQKADLDGQGGIDLDEFLEFVGPAGNTRKAVRNTLFGPF